MTLDVALHTAILAVNLGSVTGAIVPVKRVAPRNQPGKRAEPEKSKRTVIALMDSLTETVIDAAALAMVRKENGIPLTNSKKGPAPRL